MEKEVIFTKEDYEAMVASGELTREEADLLMLADAQEETIDNVGNIKETMEQYESYVHSADENPIEKTLRLASTNPKLFQSLMAAVTVASEDFKKIEYAESPALKALSQADYDKLEKTLFEQYESWPIEKRAEFGKLLESMTPAQEQELVNTLLGK